MRFLQMPSDSSCAATGFVDPRTLVANEAVATRANLSVDMGGSGSCSP